MAAMKPRTGDGPLEVTKEGRGIVMRVPLEGGGRLVVEMTPDEATALGALPSELARAAVTRELRAERRAEAYASWTIRMQKAAASKLVCERDRLPELGVVSLSAFAPFLSLHEAEAARWFAARSGS